MAVVLAAGLGLLAEFSWPGALMLADAVLRPGAETPGGLGRLIYGLPGLEGQRVQGSEGQDTRSGPVDPPVLGDACIFAEKSAGVVRWVTAARWEKAALHTTGGPPGCPRSVASRVGMRLAPLPRRQQSVPRRFFPPPGLERGVCGGHGWFAGGFYFLLTSRFTWLICCGWVGFRFDCLASCPLLSSDAFT